MQLFLTFGTCNLMRAVAALFWCLTKFIVLYCKKIDDVHLVFLFNHLFTSNLTVVIVYGTKIFIESRIMKTVIHTCMHSHIYT